MNNTFNLKRFINFEKRDFISTKKQLLIITFVIFTLFITSLIIPEENLGTYLDIAISLIVGMITVSPCFFEQKREKSKSIFDSILPISYTERFLHLILKYVFIIPIICYISYSLAFYIYDLLIIDKYTRLYIDRIKDNISLDFIYCFYCAQSIIILGYFFFKKYALFKVGTFNFLYMILTVAIIATIYNHILDAPNIEILSGLISPYQFAEKWTVNPSKILIIYEIILKTILPFGIWIIIFLRQREVEL